MNLGAVGLVRRPLVIKPQEHVLILAFTLNRTKCFQGSLFFVFCSFLWLFIHLFREAAGRFCSEKTMSDPRTYHVNK